jgi:hypothetical protein
VALPQTFSRRKRQAQADRIDVYQYDTVPQRLRVQSVQIIHDGLGEYYGGVHRTRTATADLYDFIVKSLRREAAVHELVRNSSDARSELFAWLQSTPDVDDWLDAVELSIFSIDKGVRSHWHELRHEVEAKPDDVVEELNARFLEEGFGYQYVGGAMIRVDAEVVHNEIVLPALRLLRDERFKSADQEYRDAHAAYRHGNFQDSLVGCARALESVLKVIGTERGWGIENTDTTRKLILAATTHGFLAPFHQSALTHLVGLIESSVPTVRNKVGGHGAGTEERVVPRHLAAYQLHQTAAVILFLVEQDGVS